MFLGLGTPWLMATIYWIRPYDATSVLGKKWFNKYNTMFGKEQWFKDVLDGTTNMVYVSPAGDLGPSVATFVFLAIGCVGVLMLRRKFAGGELGGPDRLRNISAAVLICFWFTTAKPLDPTSTPVQRSVFISSTTIQNSGSISIEPRPFSNSTVLEATIGGTPTCLFCTCVV